MKKVEGLQFGRDGFIPSTPSSAVHKESSGGASAKEISQIELTSTSSSHPSQLLTAGALSQMLELTWESPKVAKEGPTY